MKKRKDREGEQRERESGRKAPRQADVRKTEQEEEEVGDFSFVSKSSIDTSQNLAPLNSRRTEHRLWSPLRPLDQRHSGLVCPNDAAWRRSIGRTELLDEVAVLPERNLRRISSSGGRSSSARRPTSASATSTTSDRMLLRSAPLRRALLRRALLRSALLRRLARGGPPAPFLPRLALRLLRGVRPRRPPDWERDLRRGLPGKGPADGGEGRRQGDPEAEERRRPGGRPFGQALAEATPGLGCGAAAAPARGRPPREGLRLRQRRRAAGRARVGRRRLCRARVRRRRRPRGARDEPEGGEEGGRGAAEAGGGGRGGGKFRRPPRRRCLRRRLSSPSGRPPSSSSSCSRP